MFFYFKGFSGIEEIRKNEYAGGSNPFYINHIKILIGLLSFFSSFLAFLNCSSIKLFSINYFKVIFKDFKNIFYLILKFIIFWFINYYINFLFIVQINRFFNFINNNILFIFILILLSFNIITTVEVWVFWILGLMNRGFEFVQIFGDLEDLLYHFSIPIFNSKNKMRIDLIKKIYQIRRSVYKLLDIKESFFNYHCHEIMFNKEVFDYLKKYNEYFINYMEKGQELFIETPPIIRSKNKKFCNDFFYEIYSWFVPHVWILICNSKGIKTNWLRILFYFILSLGRILMIFRVIIYVIQFNFNN